MREKISVVNCLWISALVFLLSPCRIALSSPPTNMAMMEELAAKVAGNLISDIPLPRGATVELAGLSVSEGSWLLEEALASSLKNSKKDICVTFSHGDSGAVKETVREDSTPPNSSDVGYRLEYRIAEMSLEYARCWRKYLVAGLMVERIAKANVHARLIQMPSGELVWTGSDEKQMKDVLPASALSSLEGKSFPFSKPTLHRKGIGRFLEPLLVTGIVVGLISLFYSAK
ncbi:MAG: hypothetical protein QME66_05750 [Candidatus Eisenbacteria bacterium]|nr:hypothetical protein [Candidatus Eisenbacteria bacterium]